MRMRIVFAAILALLTTSGALAATPAVKTNLAPLFPSLQENTLALKSLQANMVQVAPAVAPDRQFSLTVPADHWTPLSGVKYLGASQGLAAFQAPQGQEAGLITVSCLKLEQEINPMDWLRQKAQAEGWREMLMRWERGVNGILFNMLAIKKGPDGKILVARLGVYRMGAMLFVVACSANQDSFPKLTRAFAVTTLFFKPDHPSKPSLVGPWKPVCMKGGLCFLAPGKGTYRGPGKEPGLEVATFPLTPEEKPAGVLQVWMIPTSAPERKAAVLSIKAFLASLVKQGFKAGKFIESRRINYKDLQGRGYLFRQNLIRKGKVLELMHLTVSTPKLLASVWMITPVPQDPSLAWARNKRVFDVVAWSLQPRPDKAKK